jgi:hypothetical protein
MANLKLYNKEFRKARVFITRIEIGIRDRDRWNLILEDHFLIKSNKYREIPFIRWNPSSDYFFVVSPAKSNADGERFGYGKYQFSVYVTLGFSNEREGLLRHFVVPVSFDRVKEVQISEIRQDG